MRVLLFSPLRGRDVAGGDTSYTDALLADPPPGVTYTTYAQALDDGSMVLRGRRPGRGSEYSDAGLFALRCGEAALRRAGAMFQEEVWFATVDADAFDAVHLHLFSLRQVDSRVPVVSSAGYPPSVLYEESRGWSARRAAMAVALEDRLARSTGAHVPWLRPSPSDLLTVYTRYFADWLVARGNPDQRVRVLGTALGALEPAERCSDGRTLAFVARDFRRKGGDVAVAAFDRLRQSDPGLTLLLATDTPDALRSLVGHPGVELFDDPPRSVVLREILPRTDVLLAPTRLDCGVPYGLLEALQRGCGIVTTTVPWLDQRLQGPAVRRVPVSIDAVCRATTELLGTDHAELARDAHELWRSTFSMAALHGPMLEAYRTAIAAHAA
jgi:glycosyltransferase involved in cell wall biosynthesis